MATREARPTRHKQGPLGTIRKMKNRKYLVYIVAFVSIFFFQCKSQTENKSNESEDTQNNKVYINPN
jgi:hypothetical protein